VVYGVALRGDVAVVTAVGDSTLQGAVYVFHKGDTGWTQKSKMTADDPSNYGYLGYNAALSGTTAVSGAPYYDHDVTNDGAVFIFTDILGGYIEKSWNFTKIGNHEKVTTNSATTEFQYADGTGEGGLANEITGVNSDSTHVSHDAAGNMEKVPQMSEGKAAGHREHTYDAWGRLVISESPGSTAEAPINRTVMTYDGLGRRITKAASGSAEMDYTYHYYYDGQQVIEVRNETATEQQLLKQNVWGTQYIDELVQIAINQDPLDDDEDVCERVFWVSHDANYNVVGVFDNGGNLIERYEQTPYGRRTVYSRGWLLCDFDNDGEVGQGDNDIYLTEFGTSDPASIADVTGDGEVDISDFQVLQGTYGDTTAADSLVHNASANSFASPLYGDPGVSLCDIAHQGLMYDKEFGLYYNRARYYHPEFGRFAGIDPGRYVDGSNLYEYVGSSPENGLDPTGWRIRAQSFRATIGGTQVLVVHRYEIGWFGLFTHEFIDTKYYEIVHSNDTVGKEAGKWVPELQAGQELIVAQLASGGQTAMLFAEFAARINPITDIYELVTGKDGITGEELALWERALAGGGVTLSGAKLLFTAAQGKRVIKLINDARQAKGLKKLSATGKQLANARDVQSLGRAIRKGAQKAGDSPEALKRLDDLLKKEMGRGAVKSADVVAGGARGVRRARSAGKATEAAQRAQIEAYVNSLLDEMMPFRKGSEHAKTLEKGKDTSKVIGNSARKISRTKWKPPTGWQGPSLTKGTWAGDAGNSAFRLKDDIADAIGVPRRTRIKFIEGTPDYGAFVGQTPAGARGVFNVKGLRNRATVT